MEASLLEPWRPGIETYRRLTDQGVFEDVRVELLDGVVTLMTPIGKEHVAAVAYLNRLAVEATDSEVLVHPQSPLSLDADWEPEPDLALIEPGTPSPYHFARAGLAIEVAATSLRRDLEVKAPVYARYGIAELWVVDLDGRRVVCHRQPGAGGYAQVEPRTAGVLQAVRFEHLRIDLDALWAATFER